jgi:hypothetical protein
LGGVAAALTAVRLGQQVILTEPTAWLGGQLTTQAVPPDEHPWVETELASPSYRRLREGIRSHYKRNYPLTEDALRDPFLNPGFGFVSRIGHEPRVGAIVIMEQISAAQASGRLTVLMETEPIAVARRGDSIESVTVRHLRTREETSLRAPLVADATELGDLLELGDVEHVVGAEARSEHGELHAPEQANPLDQQAITWCAALEWAPGTDNTITRPDRYDHFADHVAPFWPGPQLSWTDVIPTTLEPHTEPIFASDPSNLATSLDNDRWHFRRVLTKRHLTQDFPGGEITIVNWPQIDYWEKPLVGVSKSESHSALRDSRELTRSFVYWMQTEAPRWDGGHGYPELRPRGDVVGTSDGLAIAPYIRESRRIRARFTVVEGHIGCEMRGQSAGAEFFDDSVGIGYYRIDLHPSTAGRSYVDIDCFPFQIPLGALIPQTIGNLLAANKNIGTTHITNGAYRLHPVEWSIGEAVGALAAFCADQRLTPEKVHSTPSQLRRFQDLLSKTLGVPLSWPDNIRTLANKGAGVIPGT